jgi:4-alpha-glucanotransferase
MPSLLRSRIREAVAALGVRRLLLGIHDAAFPSSPGEDTGRGTPHGDAAADLLRFAAELGFDGLQLGPQGMLPAGHASPYDGAFFSREPSSVALLPLTHPAWGALLDPTWLARRLAAKPEGAQAARAFARELAADALAVAFATFQRRRGSAALEPLARGFDAFREREAEWLARDAAYEETAARGAGGYPPQLYAFVQFLAHAQHAALRAHARELGLALFGDLHVGMAARDAGAARGFLLPGYRVGAPPSRTNPEGQPWHYPLLDPRRYHEAGGDGPALRFFRARIDKAFAEYDGLRLDHPHGLVDPWVYRDEGDPGAAVRAGARLFSSPDLAEHPGLAPLAVARPDQLRRELPRHADGWVARLEPEQVDRYAVLLDALMGAARQRGVGPDAIACEILSTEPYPLARVLDRHGLGRFRVTQKADLDRPGDGYRGENARPEDWIMLGNHDTQPILRAAEAWIASGTAPRQAAYLAGRLLPPDEPPEAWIRRVAADAGELVQARAADLFVGPARQVLIFFTDLFGEREPYNVPGTVAESNWSLRLPADFRALYARRRAEGRAIDLPRALARALRARGTSITARHPGLLDTLERGGG